MPWKRKDLTGQRFGKLVAIEPIRKDHYGWIWKCKCDCGNETECVSTRLKLKRKQSCGCSLHGEGHYMWSGYKGLSGYFWRRVLERAKHRKLKVEMSVKDAWELFEKQGGKCALSGVALVIARDTKGLLEKNQTASLDRIDSSKGYTIDNIQWVHKDLNIMKMDMTENDLIYWARKIVDYSKDKKISEPTSDRLRWDNRNEKKIRKTTN
jgi:hypothetical protein